MTRNYQFVLFAALLVVSGCSQETERAPDNGLVVLVTGVTGTQGGAVAEELMKRGYRVRGLTRNPESDRALAIRERGVHMLKGDFDDLESLDRAMQGAHGVFAVTDFWEHGYTKELQHGMNLVDAARRAKVAHFVFSSVSGANVYTGIPHFESKGEIEEYLMSSDVPYTIIRPVSFMDNIQSIRRELYKGVYYDPRSGEKEHQWIAASDIGFFVGEVLDDPDAWVGNALDIAGDKMSLVEFVDVLSRALEIDIHHQQITWTMFEKSEGSEITAMYRWFDKEGYNVDVAGLRQRYPNLLTYADYLETVDWK